MSTKAIREVLRRFREVTVADQIDGVLHDAATDAVEAIEGAARYFNSLGHHDYTSAEFNALMESIAKEAP